MIPVVIPAKNEKDNLKNTITSLRATANYAQEKLFIVVVNDGSKDNTAEIAQNLNCHVVNLSDRGYSALGKPELADTHNAGFHYIDTHLAQDSYKYLMVVGADTTFEKNYLSLLIESMEKDETLVMCAGVLNNIKTNHDAVRGSGRLIRNSFWTLEGREVPNKYYSWESYPIVFALAYGYKTRTIYNAIMYTPREPLAIVDWSNYGIAMKENGSILLYVLLKAMKLSFQKKGLYRSYKFLYGYFFSTPTLYNQKLRTSNAKRQLRKIINFEKN